VDSYPPQETVSLLPANQSGALEPGWGSSTQNGYLPFGNLIGNTDMHLSNLSFIRISSRFYSLAPVYDMLPMLYRPTSGETPQREFAPGGLTRDTADVWDSALQSALHFWDRTAFEPGISREFKQICLQNVDVLSRLEVGPGIIL